MKRRREYMPRHGIRFDRRHVQGGDAGFIGSDIQVMAFTGSVERSITQNPGLYRYDTVPFAGYPRTPSEMRLAFGGKGDWVDGYLLEEFDTAITSSFDPTHVLVGQTTDRITFRMPGFRGPVDDYAIGFVSSGTVGNVANFNGDSTIGTGSYALTATSDIGLLWVGRGLDFRDANNASAYLFSKGNGGTSGWALKHAGLGSSGSLALQVEIHGVGQTRLNTVLPNNAGIVGWFIGLLAFDRSNGLMCLSTLDIQSQMFDTVYRDISALGDANGGTGGFKFGGAFSSVYPASQTVSAFYIASGTNAMSGVVGNEESLLRGFMKVIGAKNAFLFSGSAEVANSIGSFGSAESSRFVTQQVLGLGTASLGRSRGYVQITTGSAPSWTNSHIRNSAFVALALSSSDHESQVLNYYRSGTELLGSTVSQVTSKLYYVKTGSYSDNTLTKKEGRSTNIILLTGSAVNGDYAVAYRLTGALAGLSGSTPGWLLNNEFSMPWIPISSASLVDFVVEPVASIHPQTLTVRQLVDSAQRLQDAARDSTPSQTRAEYVADIVTGSLI